MERESEGSFCSSLIWKKNNERRPLHGYSYFSVKMLRLLSLPSLFALLLGLLSPSWGMLQAQGFALATTLMWLISPPLASLGVLLLAAANDLFWSGQLPGRIIVLCCLLQLLIGSTAFIRRKIFLGMRWGRAIGSRAQFMGAYHLRDELLLALKLLFALFFLLDLGVLFEEPGLDFHRAATYLPQFFALIAALFSFALSYEDSSHLHQVEKFYGASLLLALAATFSRGEFLAGASIALVFLWSFSWTLFWPRRAQGVGREILFYDGNCQFCSKAILWVLSEKERPPALLLSPDRSAREALYQKWRISYAKSAARGKKVSERSPDALALYSDQGEYLYGYEAILALLHRMGGLWKFLYYVALYLLPTALCKKGYQWIASIRKSNWMRSKEVRLEQLPLSFRARYEEAHLGAQRELKRLLSQED